MMKREVARLKGKRARVATRLEKVLATTKSAAETAQRKEYAELEVLRAKTIGELRGFMDREGKKGEELFAHVDGSGAIKEAKLVEFLQSLPGLELTDERGARLFRHIAGEDSDCISKEQFMELIRVFYKCVKGTILAEEFSIKSKTVRRLEAAEVLEVMEGPVKDEELGVQRVKCQAMSDRALGWATIAGNAGTTFLEPGGNIFSCIKETAMTDGLSVTESATIRKLAKDEVIGV